MEVHVSTLSKIAYFLDFVVWLLGAALTALGVVNLQLANNLGTVVNEELSPVMIVVIVIGGVMLFTASMGLLGVCRKQSIFLSGFTAAMIIVLLAQFAAVVILFTLEASTSYYLTDGMDQSIKFYGKTGSTSKFTEAMDFVHQELECCGAYGFDDFASPNASNWFASKLGDLPDSCCTTVTENCGAGLIDMSDTKATPSGVYTVGCLTPTMEHIQLWLTILGTVALVFMFVEVASVFLNIVLQRRYKEHEDYQLQAKKVKLVKEQDQEQEKALAGAAANSNTYATA